RDLEVLERQGGRVLAVAGNRTGPWVEPGHTCRVHNCLRRDALARSGWNCGVAWTDRRGRSDLAGRAPEPDEVVAYDSLARRPRAYTGRRCGVEPAVVEGDVELAVGVDRHPREPLVVTCARGRAVRIVARDVVGVTTAIAVRRSGRGIVVDACRPDPGHSAVRRLIEEDVVVRVPDRAVTVVVEGDINVVRERTSAFVRNDRVHDRIHAEAVVRQDSATTRLPTRVAVRAAVGVARLVEVVDR